MRANKCVGLDQMVSQIEQGNRYFPNSLGGHPVEEITFNKPWLWVIGMDF